MGSALAIAREMPQMRISNGATRSNAFNTPPQVPCHPCCRRQSFYFGSECMRIQDAWIRNPLPRVF
jgi:hypothetical protein